MARTPKRTINTNSISAKARRFRQQKLKQTNEETAVLGNGSGVVYVPLTNGNRVYVRYPGTADINGNATYSPVAILPLAVGFMGAVYDGAPVIVGWDSQLGKAVIKGDAQAYYQAGLSVGANNPNAPERQYVYKKQIVDGSASIVATGNTDSTLITVRQYPYYDDYRDFGFLPGTPTQADKLDTASYIPTDGNHVLVIVWFRTFTNDYQLTASTAQAITSPFLLADYNECAAGADAESEPILALELKNAQGTVTQTAIANDMRQLWNLPPKLGYENPLTHKARVRDNHNHIVRGSLVAVDATITVYGTLWMS